MLMPLYVFALPWVRLCQSRQTFGHPHLPIHYYLFRIFPIASVIMVFISLGNAPARVAFSSAVSISSSFWKAHKHPFAKNAAMVDYPFYVCDDIPWDAVFSRNFMDQVCPLARPVYSCLLLFHIQSRILLLTFIL